MSKLPFVPKIFFKVFAIVVVLLLAAFGISFWIYKELTITNIVGASISSLIFSYLVHLWLLPTDSPGDGGQQR